MAQHDELDPLTAPLLLRRLELLKSINSLESLRREVNELQGQISGPDSESLRRSLEQDVDIDRGYLCTELDQIGASRTLTRAHYYIDRLIKALTEVRTSPFNDINLNRWKAYDHIITDSLWMMDRRDNSGVHTAGYWGNFIPQIPRQLMLRYSKQYEWVLDPFAGAGTSLIEGQRLGRNTVGIELQKDVAERAQDLVAEEPNPHGVVTEIVPGDCRTLDYVAILERHKRRSVQLVILHPPYFDIIRFSDDPRDLSNAPSVSGFLDSLRTVAEKARLVLDEERFLALVIGDKYTRGEWIPLGFLAMNEITQLGFLLKSIVVKNFDETTGKRAQKELWRYRALLGGFYIFKHEYIFIFQKR